MENRREFLKKVLPIAVPITMQSVVMACMQLADQLMVGRLGEQAIAAIGSANKLYSILSVVLAGLATGVSIFAAQFQGKKDRYGISRTLGLGVAAGGLITLLFMLIVWIWAPGCIGFFTDDSGVIDTGSEFLRILAISFLPCMLTMMFSAILRSTGHVKLPMFASISAVAVNVLLNYALIFGHWGMPELGANGAAAATVTARMLEFGAIAVFARRLRLPGLGRVSDLWGASRPLVARFVRTTYPILMTELLWVLGETVYAVIYGRMGTRELTAMTITYPVQALGIGILTGLASAASVLIGNRIGAGEEEEGLHDARHFVGLGIMTTLGLGVLIALFSPLYVSAFHISKQAEHYAIGLLIVFSMFFWVKVSNMIIAGGILSSGGDSRFVFRMEATATWAVGVPLGLLAAFLMGLPVYWVYALISLEETVRLYFGFRRLQSRKWIHNLVKDM